MVVPNEQPKTPVQPRKSRERSLPVPVPVSAAALHVINPDAAGIDVHSDMHMVCVPADRDTNPVRQFGANTADLQAIVVWLKQCRVRTIALESTGVSWIALFELLESEGFEICLVEPGQLSRCGCGCDSPQLHHLYRAMAWLGRELPKDQQKDATPFAPRRTKDRIEEALFAHRRDLFSELQLVFFDTTSIDFEGQGGESLGQRGYSKDHRPDPRPMIVGAVLDGRGRPICCDLWPGNTTDVTTLIPVADRLHARFGISRICLVADRGMISKETIAALEQDRRGWQYILGARMRAPSEVRDEVLSRAGRYRVVHPKCDESEAPSPLDVKEVYVEGRRYIVCRNQDEARKDAADREAVVAALREQLRQGDKSLIGNKGYRRYVSQAGPGGFGIDEAKIAEDARYDGKWVLRTNTELDTAEVALQYKRLWMVEAWFRSCKSLLGTRPIDHRCDATIVGHVFCSFLALVMRQELEARLEARGQDLEWGDIILDLDNLVMTDVEQDGKRFALRSEVEGTCGAVFQAAGVALPPTVQQVEPPAPGGDTAPGATPPP